MKINFLNFKIEKEAGLTIREFLGQYYVSRKDISQLEMFNLIRVNDNVVNIHYRLKKDDLLSFKLAPLDGVIKPYKGKVDIIYEDDDIIVVNKKNKQRVNQNSKTNDSLTNKVAYYYHQKGYDYPVLSINRLDFNASGIVLYAKNFLSLSYLKKQIELNKIKKTYLAMCSNPFTIPEGIINYKIAKDQRQNKIAVMENGKKAKTNYFVLEQDNKVSKVELIVYDEKTHQIRVHLSHFGHPIIGDNLYDGDENEKLLLHLTKLEFNHPKTKEMVKFYSEENFS